MNIGDTYHGGVEAAYTSGNAIVDPINALGIDVAVPGNWDFAYGPGVFRKRYTPNGPFPIVLNPTLPPFPIRPVGYLNLAANLTYRKLGPLDPSPEGGQVLPPTATITVGGVSVGFIGITSDIVPQMYSQLATGFNFLQGEANYINLINNLAATLRSNGAAVIVVLSELGIHKDYRLAQLVTHGAVDVFFSAHTHELTFVPLNSASGAYVVEAGNDGYLGKMDITVNGGVVTSRQWSIVPITESIAEDPAMATLVSTARAPFLASNPNMSDPMGTSSQTLTQPITTVIGQANGLITRVGALESSFNKAFTDLMRRQAGTQIGISPGFRFDSPLGNVQQFAEDNTMVIGPVTIEDVYRFFPVFYTLATAGVRGDTLRYILEKLLTNVFSPNAFEQGGGWVDGFSGIRATVNLNNANYQRVLQLVYDSTNAPINPGDTLTAVGCVRPIENADVLCSHTGFFGKADLINPMTGSAYTAIQMLSQYLFTDSLSTPAHFTFFDVSGNAIWPQYQFVQPLPPSASCVTTGVENQEWNVPTTLFLSQNYPNPFNPNTTIEFALPKSVHATLEIFDLLGREVATLVDEQLPAGSYKREWHAQDMASGVYVYRLQAGEFVKTKKLLLLR